MTRKTLWLLLNLIAFQHFLVFVVKATEEAIPSPPEGNTTFLGGTTWCVARPGVALSELQVALDWACGLGKAECGPIQAGGPCFEPNTLPSHASFAFNTYYQQNGNSDIACYFGGTAVLTKNNPSYAKCVFATSESLKSSSGTLSKCMGKSIWFKVDVLIFLLLLFLA